MSNINTSDYWNKRFGGGDWESKGGFSQTRAFAESQLPLFGVNRDFDGTLCDFGCGAGDAIPVYRKAFPNAHLIGVDFSDAAIDLCRYKYGTFAEFVCGDHTIIPKSDIVISSNVFEHLSNDREIARHIKRQCKTLYIVVPFREKIIPGSEHINSYDLDSFDYLGCEETKVFLSKGWSLFGLSFYYNIYLKNVVRLFIGKNLAKQQKQIMYVIKNDT